MCLDNAQSVFASNDLVLETQAIVCAKIDFIADTHPKDVRAAWEELTRYRTAVDMFRCDDDLPLLRAAYALAIRLPNAHTVPSSSSSSSSDSSNSSISRNEAVSIYRINNIALVMLY